MDRLERLEAHRDALLRVLEVTENGRDYAALSARYMQALAEIEALEKQRPSKVVTPLDEIAAKRSAKGPARSAKRHERRG